jgi:ribosomal protein L7/L12
LAEVQKAIDIEFGMNSIVNTIPVTIEQDTQDVFVIVAIESGDQEFIGVLNTLRSLATWALVEAQQFLDDMKVVMGNA